MFIRERIRWLFDNVKSHGLSKMGDDIVESEANKVNWIVDDLADDINRMAPIKERAGKYKDKHVVNRWSMSHFYNPELFKNELDRRKTILDIIKTGVQALENKMYSTEQMYNAFDFWVLEDFPKDGNIEKIKEYLYGLKAIKMFAKRNILTDYLWQGFDVRIMKMKQELKIYYREEYWDKETFEQVLKLLREVY